MVQAFQDPPFCSSTLFTEWRKSEISDLVEPKPSEEPLAGVRAALVQMAGQHAVVPDPQQNQVTDKNKTVSMTT